MPGKGSYSGVMTEGLMEGASEVGFGGGGPNRKLSGATGLLMGALALTGVLVWTAGEGAPGAALAILVVCFSGLQVWMFSRPWK